MKSNGIKSPPEIPKLVETIEGILNPQYKDHSQDINEDNKPAVLVVDDVSSMLRATQYALRDRYKVYTLSKSKDVMDFLRNNKPDLILLDYVMPGLNGFDLIPMIQKLPEHKDTPIIIMTSEGTLEHVNEAIILGASDFIVKPFKQLELNHKVAKHIRVAEMYAQRNVSGVLSEAKNPCEHEFLPLPPHDT